MRLIQTLKLEDQHQPQSQLMRTMARFVAEAKVRRFLGVAASWLCPPCRSCELFRSLSVLPALQGAVLVVSYPGPPCLWFLTPTWMNRLCFTLMDLICADWPLAWTGKRRQRSKNPYIRAVLDEMRRVPKLGSAQPSDGETDDFSDLEDFIVCKPGRNYSRLISDEFRYTHHVPREAQ